MSKLESLFKAIKEDYPLSQFVYIEGRRNPEVIPAIQVIFSNEKAYLVEIFISHEYSEMAICSVWSSKKDKLERNHSIYPWLYWKGNYTHKSRAFSKLKTFPEDIKINSIFKTTQSFFRPNSLRFILEAT